MGLFSKTKTVDTSKAPEGNADKKIVLNFCSKAPKTLAAIAAATLEAGGFDAATAARKPAEQPKIGDKMPDGTIYAGTSPDTGGAMYTTPQGAPLTYTFNQARKYASRLEAHDHQDWRVPTKNELNVLFNNRAAIGGFDVSGSYPAGRYWSSVPDGNIQAATQRFSDGDQTFDLATKYGDSSLRCVRG
jgi:uncharacterized protein DUF1566